MSEKTPNYVKCDTPESFSKAMSEMGNPIIVHKAIGTNIYQNITSPNISVRDGYNRSDYDFFRPDERLPETIEDVIFSCMKAKKQIGIIRNIIDMMAEIVCQGIDVVHKSPRAQTFYKAWAKKIRLKNRAERIANLLLTAANVVISRKTAKLKEEDIDRLAKKGMASPVIPSNKIKPFEIPIKYVIHNPLSVEVYDEELSELMGEEFYKFGLKVPTNYNQLLLNGQIPQNQKVIKIKKKKGGFNVEDISTIPLDPKNTLVAYYKKDDWEVWATPMLYSILEDLSALRKMKLADLSALDGAISRVRLWKLGSLEHKIAPTENAFSRLADMLLQANAGGSIDLIWGPDITLEESNTDVSKFLGEEKYKPILQAIYGGLGIPPSLTGIAGASGSSGENYIGLKTLIQRMEYVRDVLVELFQKELNYVQIAMGFKEPAQLVFDYQALSDEASLQRILIEMSDRGLISDELVQERIRAVPEVESVRLKREDRQRKKFKRPQKLGPFTKDIQEAVKTIFAGSGVLTPEDFGIEPKNPQYSKLLIESKTKPKEPKGEPGQGRPSGLKDKLKRKKRVKKVTKGYLEFEWAVTCAVDIASTLLPIFLNYKNKASYQDLNSDEINEFDEICVTTLSKIKSMSRYNKEQILSALTIPSTSSSATMINIFKECVSKKQLTHLEKISIMAQSHVICTTEIKLV